MSCCVHAPCGGSAEMVKSVIGLAKSAVVEPWNFPPTIRSDQDARGKYRTRPMLKLLPRSSPAHAPFPPVLSGASKYVLVLPSNTFWIVLPEFTYEPAVPITVPVTLLSVLTV